MGLSRRIFTKEFKLAAIQRLEQGVSLGEVARALEVNPNVTSVRKRMMEELQLRNLSPITADTYLRAVERFARYYNLSPEKMGPEWGHPNELLSSVGLSLLRPPMLGHASAACG